MTGYSDIIKKGREQDKSKEVKDQNSKAVNTNVGKTVNTEDEKPVNITIKVPRKSRQYWTSQCKLQGVTMTEVLVEALTERFGDPN